MVATMERETITTNTVLLDPDQKSPRAQEFEEKLAARIVGQERAVRRMSGLYPEHDIFIQLMKLKNTLRHLRGEDLITHLGLEYYD